MINKGDKKLLSESNLKDIASGKNVSRSKSLSRSLSMWGPNIVKEQRNIMQNLDEIEKISKFNDYVGEILAAVTRDDGIIPASKRIKECKENELWDKKDIICKMLEESIESNVENARKAEELSPIYNVYKILQKTVLDSIASDEKQEVIKDNSFYNIKDLTETNEEKLKRSGVIFFYDIKDLAEHINEGLPIDSAKLETYIELIKNIASVGENEYLGGEKWINELKVTLEEKINELEQQLTPLQEKLVAGSMRIISHTNEIKEINNLKLTQMALKIDLAINKLKDEKMSTEQLKKINEIERKWKKCKIELKDKEKLKDISSYSEWKKEKQRSFWSMMTKKQAMKGVFKDNIQYAKERLKDTEALRECFNAILVTTKELDAKVGKLKPKNESKEVLETKSKVDGMKKEVINDKTKSNEMIKELEGALQRLNQEKGDKTRGKGDEKTIM